MASQVRVYMGCSVDGCIAGVGGDISFLSRAQADEEGDLPKNKKGDSGVSYETFMSDIGSMLIGRNTYTIVDGFDGPWPYGKRPVFVATNRPLNTVHPYVQPIKGSIEELVDKAKQAANGKDVYIDGGQLIRQALDAGLIDELIITMVPILLGKGISLFSGLQKEHMLEFIEVHRWNQKSIQWIARPRKQ